MYSVILVDDEEMILRGLLRLVPWEDYGLEVKATATDGAQAWKLFQENRFDIVITDIRMPHMDGIALLKNICTHDASTKCIVLSGYDDFAYIKQALQLGIENYLLKPIDEEELSATLLSTTDKLDSESRQAHISRLGEDTLRDHLIERWLAGSMAWDEMKSRAALVGLCMEAAWYIVVIACVGEGFDSRSIPRVRKDVRLFASTMDPQLVTLLLAGEGTAPETEKEALSLFNQPFPSHIDLGVSSAVFRLEEVPVAKREANRSLVWHKLLPGHVNVLPVSQSGGCPDGAASKAQLAIAVKRGASSEMIEQALGVCHAEIESQPSESGQFAIFYDLLEIIDTEGPQVPSASLEEHPTTMAEAWEAFCIAIRHQAEQRIYAPANPAIEAIYRYVDEHYQDDISLKKLGDDLHFNPAYLGQLFKQQSGILFLDYLCAYRIDKAKNLLATSVYRSGDIAKMVGFRNPNYFANVFHKLTGLYPTVYRKKLRDNNACDFQTLGTL